MASEPVPSHPVTEGRRVRRAEFLPSPVIGEPVEGARDEELVPASKLLPIKTQVSIVNRNILYKWSLGIGVHCSPILPDDNCRWEGPDGNAGRRTNSRT